MQGIKTVTNLQSPTPRINEFYVFRLRWSEPTHWGDDGELSKREYEMGCRVEYRGRERMILSRRVNQNYQGYMENLRFPNDSSTMVRCQVRPRNSLGMVGTWTYSDRINISQVPIYFPGVIGFDLRGIRNEDIVSVFRNLMAEEQATGSGGNFGSVDVNFKSAGDSSTTLFAPIASRPQTPPNFDTAPLTTSTSPPLVNSNQNQSRSRIFNRNDEWTLVRPNIDLT